MSYTTTIGITIGTAGLTLNAQLVTTAGANSGGVISSGFVDATGGYYMLTLSIPDGFQGGLKIINTADSSVVGFTTINPRTDENLDTKVSALPALVMDQPLTGHTANGTAGHALQLARADAGGKWTISADTLTIYDLDGTTVVAQFHLTPTGNSYDTRTPF